MTSIRICISSAQCEFVRELRRLRDNQRGDPLLRRFFKVFVFEDVSASVRRPDGVHLDGVERCDIYVGLFGQDHGYADAAGVSHTEQKFDRVTELEKHLLIFVHGAEENRHPKMHALIGRVQAGLAEEQSATSAELKAGLYSALLQYFEAKGLLRFGPLDAAQCFRATLNDLDSEGMPLHPHDALGSTVSASGGNASSGSAQASEAVEQRTADECRSVVVRESASTLPDLLRGQVWSLPRYRDRKADSLLPGQQGRGVRVGGLGGGIRPEQDRAVGGDEGGEHPGACGEQVQWEAAREAIVNAVAHRDYTDNNGVQVILLVDRLKIMNSGRLPPLLNVENLLVAHMSLPGNPWLAESMHMLRILRRWQLEPWT